MIIIVDDDPDMLELIQTSLDDDGHDTMCFESALNALKWMEKHRDVSVIISDVSMPVMDGFEFKKEFSRLYPNRAVPFLFLSSMAKTDDIVKGFDSGADDYMIKPVHPAVLKARIRSVLRSVKHFREPLFHGDLSKFPFIKLLQFCENRKHSGQITIISGDIETTVEFQSGELIEDTPGFDDRIFETLMDLNDGEFTIYSNPVEFDDIEFASKVSSEEYIKERGGENRSKSSETSKKETLSKKDYPMGRLSGIKAGTRTFQIQTEVALSPLLQIVTIVVLNGRTLLKKVSEELNVKADFKALINSQHESVERQVREKLLKKIEQKKESDEQEDLKISFGELLDKGLDEFMSRNYKEAVAIWEKAIKLEPENKALAVNLRIAKDKIS